MAVGHGACISKSVAPGDAFFAPEGPPSRKGPENAKTAQEPGGFVSCMENRTRRLVHGDALGGALAYANAALDAVVRISQLCDAVHDFQSAIGAGVDASFATAAICFVDNGICHDIHPFNL